MKLHYKIALGVTLIQTGFLIFSTAFNAEKFKVSIREEFASKTDSKAQFLALKISRLIEKNDYELAEKIIKKNQTEDPIVYVRVVRNKKTVLDINQANYVSTSSSDNANNFVEYLKKTQNERRILDAYAPITDTANKTIAELQMGMSFFELDETISKYYKNQMVLLLFQIAIINSFVWILSYLITRRLARLEAACETVDINNLSFDLASDTSGDEIGSLTRSFFKMTKELGLAVKERDQQKEKTIAASKMSALGEMAGGIAHEINNPLAIILGKVDLIRIKVSTQNISQEQLLTEIEKIDLTCQRIVRIIRGLRNFSRDGDKDPFVKTKVKQILEDTLELCKTRFQNKEIDLRVNADENIAIECRPVQISQIILNLLNNSLHAIEKLNEKWVSIDVIDQADSILISITDSGKGIPKAIAEKLHQPFFTTKDVGVGTGLGLSISTGIAQQHNGYLKLDSEAKNTRFIVCLPKQHFTKMAA